MDNSQLLSFKIRLIFIKIYYYYYYFFSETNLQLYGTFFMFGAILTTLLPISYIILPETKDISLGQSRQKTINLTRN